MHEKSDVIIAGGGLAGLTAAIHLSKTGLKVILIEKQSYPQHKVCGEYISNEVLPYLQSLDVDPLVLQPTFLNQFEFSNASGKLIKTILPLGGFGLSRYVLDEFLMKKALENGCFILQDTVQDITFLNDEFTVVTSANDLLRAPVVLGAFGKRTALDQKLKRTFIQQKSPWLAVKAHYLGDFSNNTVALHHFKGGYCGVSKVENNRINICYLTHYDNFKKHRNLNEFQQNVLYKNKHLKSILENSTMEFEEPLSIGQINFDKKEAVNAHILMIGDAAGLIHPLCGNGMGMAIHSAKICSALVIKYLHHKVTSRMELENEYHRLWQHHFKQRLAMGRLLSNTLQKAFLSDLITTTLVNFPFILPALIKRTHGKPLKPFAYED